MKNKLFLIFGIISFIGLISAGAINLQLEPIENIYSGDLIQKNLTITTTQDLLVYLSHNVSEGINLSYKNPIQVNGIKIIPINISFNKYLESENYEIIIYANAEGESQTSSSSGSSGGGSNCNFYFNNNLYKKSYLITLRKGCDLNFELLIKHKLRFDKIDLLGQVILVDKKTDKQYALKNSDILCLENEIDGLNVLIQKQSNSYVRLDLSLVSGYCGSQANLGYNENQTDNGQGNTIPPLDTEIPLKTKKPLKFWLILIGLGISIMIWGILMILIMRQPNGKNN